MCINLFQRNSMGRMLGRSLTLQFLLLLSPTTGKAQINGSTTSWTTGPLIWLSGEDSALDLGPKTLSDTSADYHPSWFGGQDDQGPPYRYHGPVYDRGGDRK